MTQPLEMLTADQPLDGSPDHRLTSSVDKSNLPSIPAEEVQAASAEAGTTAPDGTEPVGSYRRQVQDGHATDPADDSQKSSGHSRDPWAALMEALVEAVLTLPEFEKKQVIDQSMAPLFEALLTLPTIPRMAGIWWLLTACGYPDYAKRLVLPGANFSEKTPAVPPASSATTPKSEEAPDVA
jgi:hypothetical protein